MTNFIVNGNGLGRLEFLLRFLVAWEKRPTCLAPMSYGWCSASFEPAGSGAPPRTQSQHVATGAIARNLFPPGFLPPGPFTVDRAFACAGPLCDPIRSGDASHHTRERPQNWVSFNYPHRFFFLMILEIGFRLVVPGPALRLGHAPHRDLVFKHTFSSGNDEVVADSMCAWIADSDHMPAGSCVHYLAKRMEQDPPFSPRLRQMGIRLIEHMRNHGSRLSGPKIIRLLNRLDVSVDDMEDEHQWAVFLVGVICSPAGFKGLSVHYWHIMGRLPRTWGFPIARAMELARLLEETEDWEKLEVWMVIAWRASWEELKEATGLEILEYLKQVTLEHLLRRPSALPRFEAIPRPEYQAKHHSALEDICTQVRAGQLPLEPPSP